MNSLVLLQFVLYYIACTTLQQGIVGFEKATIAFMSRFCDNNVCTFQFVHYAKSTACFHILPFG